MSRLLGATILIWISCQAFSQKFYSEMSSTEKKLYDEHILKGQPDGKTAVLVRHGYVAHYNPTYRFPDWVAYHIIPAYLDTPERKGRFGSFRTDPEIEEPVVDDDYTGTGYARGHMAPYFAMGGHRDGDLDDDFDPNDEYDETTIYQANYLTNISPQHQLGLNGPGGAWYALETVIRNKLVGDKEMELNVITGAIVVDSDNYKTLRSSRTGNTGIAIPNEFFQVIIYWDRKKKEYITAAFLFPHVKKKPGKPLLDFLVSVDELEKRTGLDFLNQLSKGEQEKIEKKDNYDFWKPLIK